MNNLNMRKFGVILKEERNKKRMSQAELTEITGISQPTLVRYENGNSEPRKSDINKLASALGVSVSYLMGENDDAGNLPPAASEIGNDVPDAPPDSIVFEYSKGDEKIKLTMSAKMPNGTIQATIAGAVRAVFGDATHDQVSE